jgi:hypothetical protein
LSRIQGSSCVGIRRSIWSLMITQADAAHTKAWLHIIAAQHGVEAFAEQRQHF